MALHLTSRNVSPINPADLQRHPASMEADKNAFVVPESMVISKRKNEQLHLIPMSDSDGKGIVVRMSIYVNGGLWDGKMWYGYQKQANATIPMLTQEGLRMLAVKAAELSKEIDDTLAQG
jgi:hypothetical protein